MPRMIAVGLFQILALPIVILTGALFVPSFIIALLLLILLLGSPFLVLIFVYSMGTCAPCLKIFLTILTVILYPLISIIIVLVVIIFFLLYPVTRGNFNYHHGIFDPIEELVLNYVAMGLKTLVCIIDL